MSDPRLIPLEAFEFDRAFVLLFERWLRYTAAPLLRSLSDEEPGDHAAVVRPDGGLWLTGGTSLVWTIYDVPAGRWALVSDGDG
mgnify:CR=1